MSHLVDDCIFCKIIRREIPAEIVYENDEVLAFKDIRPLAPVHLLVIPKTHVATVNDVDASNRGAIAAVMQSAGPVADTAGVREEGYRVFFNVGRGAGQVVFHVHMHLIARADLREIVSKLEE